MPRGRAHQAAPNWQLASSSKSQTQQPHGTQSQPPQAPVKKILPPQRGTKRRLHTINDKPLRRSPRFTALKNTPEINTTTPANGQDELFNSVEHWLKEGKWPGKDSVPGNVARLLARILPPSQARESPSYLTTPIDQNSGGDKSLPYRSPYYQMRLAPQGCFMEESSLGITDESKTLVQYLLDHFQPVPWQSIFEDDVFKAVCSSIQYSNQSKVIQDISRLIVPSAETHALRAKGLGYLRESVNKGWDSAIPLFGVQPQPDYSVGFKRQAFTNKQLGKLGPFLSDLDAGSRSFFMSTFDFMAIAVRGVAELFRFVERDNEIDRQILAFSISHSNRDVRIYGHYADMSGKDIKYYRHAIRAFDFTDQEGKEKWVAYRFTKNIYDIWVPAHYRRLCAAIDKVPDKLDLVSTSPQEDNSSAVPREGPTPRLDAESSPPTEQDDSSGDTIMETVSSYTALEVVTDPEVNRKRKRGN